MAQKTCFVRQILVRSTKIAHNSLNIARRGLKPQFSERAFNFTSRSAFLARLQLLGCVGWSSNANAFSLHPDEKSADSSFFTRLGCTMVCFLETFSTFRHLYPIALRMGCQERLKDLI